MHDGPSIRACCCDDGHDAMPMPSPCDEEAAPSHHSIRHALHADCCAVDVQAADLDATFRGDPPVKLLVPVTLALLPAPGLGSWEGGANGVVVPDTGPPLADPFPLYLLHAQLLI